MSKTITLPINSKQEFNLSLDEIAREGARRMLCQALDLEVEEYISQNTEQIDERGHRLVVRNGLSQSRTVTMSSGSVLVKAPRVEDKREGHKFLSKILPPYLR